MAMLVLILYKTSLVRNASFEFQTKYVVEYTLLVTIFIGLSVFFSHLDDGVKAPVEVHQRRKEMPEELRKQVYQVLLGRSKNGKLGKKDTQIVGDQFDLHIRSVQRIWKRGKIQLANSVLVVVSSLKKGRVVRKKFMLIWKLCVTFL